MAAGKGIYGDECDEMQERTKAQTIVLVIIDGKKGSGFSMNSTDQSMHLKLPGMLRLMADEIERDGES